MYIRLEDKIDMFEVSGYSLVSMLSEVGGFFSIMFAVSQMFVYLFAKDRFFGSLIEILFRTKQPNGKLDKS